MVREWPFIEYVVRESRRTHLRRTSTYYKPGQLQPQSSLRRAQWSFLFDIVQKLWCIFTFSIHEIGINCIKLKVAYSHIFFYVGSNLQKKGAIPRLSTFHIERNAQGCDLAPFL